MKKRVDLHIHSNLSDGVLSPKEIVDKALENGVSVISITDHDNIDAYDNGLYDYARENNIKIINGVEISTKVDGVGIHVLGYGFDINNEALREKLYLLRNARHDYLYKVSDKLRELGFVINVDRLDKIDAVTKAHIALDIINNRNNYEVIQKWFGHDVSKGEFIEALMNKGCACYVEKETINPVDAVCLIKDAGGKAVLAHPVSYKYEDNLSDEDIFQLICDMRVDGIEANYVYLDRNKIKINESDKWRKIAKNMGLFTTIGSDFHNSDGIHSEIGLINEDLDIDNYDLEEIVNNLVS